MSKQNAILTPDITDGDSGTRDLNLPFTTAENPWASSFPKIFPPEARVLRSAKPFYAFLCSLSFAKYSERRFNSRSKPRSTG